MPRLRPLAVGLLVLIFVVGSSCGSPGGESPPPAPSPSPLSLVADVSTLVVSEGASASFSVRLSSAPDSDVTVETSVEVGDTIFSVPTGSSLVFTPDNWNVPQDVTVTATTDSDDLNDFGRIQLMLDGGLDVEFINLTQRDTDGAPITDGVPLKIKDASGIGAVDFPVSVVIPLAYGRFQDTSSFRIVDPRGDAIAAQFQVLNRWWARDNSIRHVLAQFFATVAPDDEAVYTFRKDGAGPAPSSTVSVAEGGGVYTVDTGVIRFTVKKDGFNLFDEVFLDTNGDGSYAAGERIVAPDATGGPVFTGRVAGDVQRASARTDLKAVVEESGPLRAVIRVSGLTLYNGADDHTHGFAVRFYAYAGKSFVKVDYQLQNSSKTQVFSAPLYFEDLSLDVTPALSSPTLSLAPGPGNVWSGDPAGGRYLFQSSLTASAVHASADGATLLTGANPRAQASFGWADLSDADRGLFVAIRHMAEMWPNGIEVESDGTVAVRLWPRWSAQLYGGEISPTGLYWLEDMQHVVKECLYYFHGANTSAAELDQLAQTFQYHPIPFVPIGEYARTKATMTLSGIIPATEAVPAHEDQPTEDTKRIIIDRREYVHDVRTDQTSDEYNFGWQNFMGDVTRKIAKLAGDLPQSSYRAISTERVDEWLTAEAGVLGELNCRPQWLAEYNRDADLERIYPVVDPYGGRSWRRHLEPGDGDLPLDSPHIAGTGFLGWYPRDNEHGWHYHVEAWYFVTGDLWIRDWYEWIKEFRKSERSLTGMPGWSTLRVDGWEVPRAEAHSISSAMQAYRITGDPAILEWLRRRLDNLELHWDPYSGTYDGYLFEPSIVSIFEHGFVAHALIQVMDEVEGYDPELYHRLFPHLWGVADFNLELGSFTYHFDLARMLAVDLYGYPDSFPAPSSGPGMTLADPQAWFGLTTGMPKYLDQVNEYIDFGLHGGIQPYDGYRGLYSLRAWTGAYAYVGRVTQFVRDHPPVPDAPAAITDLAASVSGGQIRLNWTTPADAARFHVYWSTLPFTEAYTTDTTEVNPWGGTPVWDNLPPAAPGTIQTLDFGGAPSGQRIYVVILARSADGHMSAMSNVAEVVAP
ncbi:MAG: exo-rhamnogalacturonan lyase family protein [Planctomycetota bacterium]|jgi:hypothetical protein